ncbi:hypothetical protein P0Y35_05830 [Kiritimatiellaeota bacterium B1221]|nr:hypothetical protein [Kiritimatiellaeota bacterium B1221]
MKPYLLMFCILASSLKAGDVAKEVIASSRQPKEYSISDLSPQVTKKIYDKIKGTLHKTESTFAFQYADFRIREGNVVLNPTGLRTYKVSQTIGNGMYLVNSNDFALQLLPRVKEYAEGERIAAITIRSGNFNYSTVLGASRTIPKLVEITQETPTYDEFLIAVRLGEEFRFTMPMSVTCPKCKGTRFYEEPDERRPGEKVKKVCNGCPGSFGKIPAEIGFILKK